LLRLSHYNLQKIFWSALSGLLLTMAFPKTGLFWLAFTALIPFLYVIKDTTPKQSAFYGLIFGVFHFFSLLIWMIFTLNTYGFLPVWICIPILFLLAFYLSLYTAAFAWITVRFFKNRLSFIIVTPALWVVLEYIKTHALTGFPWEIIGYSQYSFLNLIQISDKTGVYGVSFIVLSINTALFTLLLYAAGKEWQSQKLTVKSTATTVIVTALIFIFCIVYGHKRRSDIASLSEKAGEATISVIQGNIDQSLKWKKEYQLKTIDKYVDLSYQASLNKPDLIVWPETAAPFYYQYNQNLTNKIMNSIDQTKTAHLLGSPSFKRENKSFVFYNSAFLTTADGVTGEKYNKVHLVPFGEYVPMRKFLPFIKKITEQSGNFLPGEKGKILALNDIRLGVQICFEVVFPDLTRAAVKNGANIIVNMTNDAWFGKKSAPLQHFSMVVFRAVENRRAVARAANTGISGFIDPTGKIISQTDLFKDAHLTEKLPLINTISFYTKYGDLFAGICFLIIICTFFSDKYHLNKLFTSNDR